MTIINDPQHRARWLARVAHAQNELVDLQTEIDIAMRQKMSFVTMTHLAHADTHLDRAKMELDQATAEIGGLE